jgi:MHS family proline/betaine transporter-like MFS transporter
MFGWLADRAGRRSTLLIVVVIMGVATILIGLLPTYAGIGAAAPILLVLARGAQGLSLGGEFSTSAAFLVEFAPRNRRGFYGSFTYGSATAGSTIGVALVFGLTSGLGADSMLSFGWRIPFLVSFPLLLIGFYLRYRLSETPHFQELRRARADCTASNSENLWTHKKAMLQVIGIMVAMATGSYILLSFMISYLLTVMRYPPSPMYWSVILTALFGAAVTLIVGRISDSVGRRPVLITACMALVVLSYPAFLLLSSGVVGAFLGQLVLWSVLGTFSGAIPAAFSELFPTRFRAAGLGISYAVATAALSGITPLAATALVRASGNLAAPGWYLTGAGLISLPTALWMKESLGRELD